MNGNLQQIFNNQLRKDLQKKLKLKHQLAVPELTKIVVNMGVKDALTDKKNLERGMSILTDITGQKPKVTKAKKSIAGFKLRQGDQIGLMVTLRGRRMYDFFDKLVKVVFPRIRNFHGVSRTSFDGQGNYSLGFSEHLVFPEIDPGKVDKIQGLEISIITSAKDDKEVMILLEAMGMPFVKEVVK